LVDDGYGRGLRRSYEMRGGEVGSLNEDLRARLKPRLRGAGWVVCDGALWGGRHRAGRVAARGCGLG